MTRYVVGCWTACLVLAALAAGGAACSDDDSAPPAGSLVVPTRFDLHAAGAGCVLTEAACGVAEMPAGCDPCEALDYYGDLVCDQPLIDAGTDVGLPFGGAAPDLGCFEAC